MIPVSIPSIPLSDIREGMFIRAYSGAPCAGIDWTGRALQVAHIEGVPVLRMIVDGRLATLTVPDESVLTIIEAQEPLS